jgi:4-hydroxybenzoate polyprenyltransferase
VKALAHPHPIGHWRFWRAFVVTMRPYLLCVSGASGLLGLALEDALHGPWLVAAAFAFFLVYGFGQAITDTFQTDTDALSSPYRPLVRGEITRAQVLGVSLGALLVIALFFAWLNPWTLLPAALAIAGVALYTPFKRRWWGGPPWNSWVVATLPLLGVLLGGSTPTQALVKPQVWLALGSVYFSYAVFVLLGYFKDVRADRATGYDTLVVHFGRRVALWVSALHGLLALACSIALLPVDAGGASSGWSRLAAVGLWTLGSLSLVLAHWRMAGTTRDEQAHGAIACSVVGYVALHLGEAALLRPALTLAAVSILPLALLLLLNRPEKTQV